jgi:hypothetical protein
MPLYGALLRVEGPRAITSNGASSDGAAALPSVCSKNLQDFSGPGMWCRHDLQSLLGPLVRAARPRDAHRYRLKARAGTMFTRDCVGCLPTKQPEQSMIHALVRRGLNGVNDVYGDCAGIRRKRVRAASAPL